MRPVLVKAEELAYRVFVFRKASLVFIVFPSRRTCKLKDAFDCGAADFHEWREVVAVVYQMPSTLTDNAASWKPIFA